jgi:hypothetical protein
VLLFGGRVVRDDVEYAIEEHAVGVVTAPSGQIVGCDPLTDADEALPFTATVPPGHYELRAWTATMHRDGSEPDVRTVALQLVVNEQPAVRWEPALTEGQDPAGLAADDYFGYPVDAGVGTLADVTAVRALARWDFDRLDDAFIPAPVSPAPAPIHAITDEATATNVITVSSGWGRRGLSDLRRTGRRRPGHGVRQRLPGDSRVGDEEMISR